jgi:hypothetical protein
VNNALSAAVGRIVAVNQSEIIDRIVNFNSFNGSFKKGDGEISKTAVLSA